MVNAVPVREKDLLHKGFLLMPDWVICTAAECMLFLRDAMIVNVTDYQQVFHVKIFLKKHPAVYGPLPSVNLLLTKSKEYYPS